jgi:hypothetical protein
MSIRTIDLSQTATNYLGTVILGLRASVAYESGIGAAAIPELSVLAPNSPAQVEQVDLANGANTLYFPIGSQGVIIIPSIYNTLMFTETFLGSTLDHRCPVVLFHGNIPTTPMAYTLTWTGPSWVNQAVNYVAATDTFTLAAHGLVAGVRVRFNSPTPSSGITEGVWYYVYDAPTVNTFRIAETADAAAPMDILLDGTASLFTSQSFTIIHM